MGMLEEIKSIFTERTIAGLGYATVSGLAAGTLGALFERWTNSKYAAYLGDIIGGGIMAYVADRYFGHPEWKGYAVFGALFPPVWEAVTDKISPEDLANKVGASLGLTWNQAAKTTYAQPVAVTVTPVQPAPQPVPAEQEVLF